MNTKSLLLTGASSPAGSSLQVLLKSQGFTTVKAVSRRPQNQISRVEGLQADLSTTGVLAALMRQSDILVHIAGLPLLVPELKVLDSSRIQQIIAFSTSSVLTKSDSPNQAESELIQSIAKAEQQLIELCESRSLLLSIIRPTLIWGAGRDQNVSRIAHWAQSHRIFPSYRGLKGLRQPVHVDVLAALVVKLIMAQIKGSHILTAAGGEVLDYRQMVSRIYATLEKKPIYLPLPAWMVDLAVRFPSPLQSTLVVLHCTRQDMLFEPEPLLDELGWQPRGFTPDRKALGCS